MFLLWYYSKCRFWKIITQKSDKKQPKSVKNKFFTSSKIAEEDTKYGLEVQRNKKKYSAIIWKQVSQHNNYGLMGMATFTNNKNQVKSEFLILKSLFDELSKFKKIWKNFMGMSDDFRCDRMWANSVRIGSAIFGNRNY